MQARRKWHDIFKVLKGKNLQPRILYPARLSFRLEGERKNFSDKPKLKEFSNTKPILTEILKGLLFFFFNIFIGVQLGYSINIKEARIYRKGKITAGKANI